MSRDLQWKNPPEANEDEPGYELKQTAHALRARPQEWALIKTYPRAKGTSARAMAMAIRTGRYVAFRPPATFEAKSATQDKEENGETVLDKRGNPVKEVNVYARYVGET